MTFPYHGLPAEVRVHLCDLVLVHVVELGVHLVLGIDDVLLQELLGDLLQA